ncbi:response regulator transcription factor [Aeromicrobium sp. Marseille-Q0843]|uniref:Response regulator transcription factor n=1 Tax=Aeromicrobium phoceense TaxID=2754045 RepID=A0A838X733_9ACTN|nr:LytTR family DNA-binding domain-containing protein [Aeromicrobium phoceense]MBA4607309.1 response regulator transcription factor [Aeromicrobium phoceense]
MARALRTLVVDDEQPVLDELVWLLGRDDRIGTIDTARSGTEALRRLDAGDIDLLFLDIAMPGLTGIDIARLLGRFKSPPQIIFVTAHDAHAVEAFDLNAVDYLLKPIREERLRESVRRAVADSDSAGTDSDDTIAVELAGVTRFVSRSKVTHAEAQGDYVRLHTLDGASHLIRTPLTSLAEDWADAGFLRIHRSIAVNRAHILEVRMSSGRASVVVPAAGGTTTELQVARRHTRALRELIGEHTP